MDVSTIKEALYQTVHRNDKAPKEIADDIGVSYNYLMRSALDTESGCDFNLKYLVPLMRATDDYTVLKQLAKRSGYLVIKAPRGTKKGTKQDIQSYQVGFNKMITKLIQFAQQPTEERHKELDEMMREHIAESETMRRRAKKNLVNQTELF